MTGDLPLRDGSLPEGALEAALRAAWAPDEAAPAVPEPSILEEIEAEGGEVPRVLLRDGAAEPSSAPVVLPASPDAGPQPTGKRNLQVLGEIARGGVGVILKGRDTDLGRDVAIKVLRAEHAEKHAVLHRFVEEAQIGGQLQHPGIVPVYELGRMPDRRPYFSMKLVNGRTLAEMLRDEGTDPEARGQLLSVFERVCETMAYAHDRGVIHRDLKPANVMVGAFGEVQVVDWGLSKVLGRGGIADEERASRGADRRVESIRSGPHAEGTTSLVGTVLGTPAYMPPEQASGDPDRVDERSDVFALGAVLCELLTGAPPYGGSGAETLAAATAARLDGALERLDRCGADAELVDLARQCLARDPRERPRNAGVLAARVARWRHSVEERAERDRIAAAESRVKVAEERRARRLTSLLLASLLLLVVGAGATWTWLQAQQATRLQRTRDGVNEAITEAASHEAGGRWSDARASLAFARSLAGEDPETSELRERILGLEARVEAGARRAREAERLRDENRALVACLDEVRHPEGVGPSRASWIPVGDLYAAIFEDYGMALEGATPEASAAAVRARGIDGELAGRLDTWARVRAQAGSRARAEHLARTAVLLDDDPARTALRRAWIDGDLEAFGRFAEEQRLEDLPARTLNLLAGGLVDAQRFDRAVDVYRTSVARHPDDFRATRSLALQLRQADPPRPEEAVRYYTAAIALRPEVVEVRHQLGVVLEIDLERYADAAHVFRAALGMRPDDGHLHEHLGRCLHALGDVAGAVEAFDASVRLEASHVSNADQYAWRLATDEDPARRDLAAAVRFAEHACAVTPREAAVWDTLAVVRYRAGDWDGCLEALERSMELTAGGDAYPWFYASLSHARAGRPAQARGWYDRAVAWTRENAPDDEELRDLRADAARLLGLE